MPRFLTALIVLAVLAPVSASAASTGAPPLSGPAAVDFGARSSGTTTNRLVTIVNRSRRPVTLGPAGIVPLEGDGFAMHDPAKGACFGANGEIAELQAGGRCSIFVSFSPSGSGAYRARLIVAVDGFSSSLEVAVSGSSSAR